MSQFNGLFRYKDNYELVIDLFYKLTGLAARDYLNTMLLFDFLICNEDRHLNNFGVLKDKTDGSSFSQPLFDSGYALGFMQAEHRRWKAVPVFLQRAKPFSTSFFQTTALGKISSRVGLSCRTASPDTVLDGSAAVCTDARLLSRTILQIRLQQLKEVFRMKPVDFTIYWEETPTVTGLL